MRKDSNIRLPACTSRASLLAILLLASCELETAEDEWDVIDDNITSIDTSDTSEDTLSTSDDEQPASDDELSSFDISVAGSNSERIAFQFFVRKGLTRIQSAGIIGNLMQESSMDPRAIEFPSGPGRGIAQWSFGGRWNHDHLDNVEWYARLHHASRWDLDLQLHFIWYELRRFQGVGKDPDYGLKKLGEAKSIPDAVHAFQGRFERCGTCDSSNRIEFARQALRMFR